MGPISLHKSVLNYDKTISTLEREMLLINIARMHRDIPSHFTVTSRIAATFDYKSFANGAGNIMERLPGINTYSFDLGLSVAENPTLSIIPVQGEEFTTRILTPMDESKFLFLAYQGASFDMIMRLMVRGIEVQDEDGIFQRFILNWPIRHEEYEEFRKIALHLAWLNYNRNLFVGRLHYKETVDAKLKSELSAGDIMSALDKDYNWQETVDGEYEITRNRQGRIAITNYDLNTLTDSERQTLNKRMAAKPGNFIFVHIRKGFPGGDFPLLGAIKLRSFNEIMEFVASAIDSTPEFDVAPDQRSGSVSTNPTSTLKITINKRSSKSVPRISFKWKKYGIGNTDWDNDAFKLLYHLFQMTVTDVSGLGIPITITK